MMESLESVRVERPELCQRFKVLGKLGEGAAGQVYYALDRRMGGREVALKVLTNEHAFDDHTVERFREELRICQELKHPNLIEAYELVHLDGALAFSMEFVRGADLSKLFFQKRFTYQQIDLIYDQLLAALDMLHAHGVLHRDIKLENLLLREDGTIKLSDLGLIKQYGKEVTTNGVILGTAHYFPPEYVSQGVYDVRSEIYVLGTMLFEMLTGKRWLQDMTGAAALQHMIKNKFRFPLESLVEVDPKYRRILENCLAVNPSLRFQSANELRKAFSGVFSERAISPQVDLMAPTLILSDLIANTRILRHGQRHYLWQQMGSFVWWQVRKIPLAACAGAIGYYTYVYWPLIMNTIRNWQNR